MESAVRRRRVGIRSERFIAGQKLQKIKAAEAGLGMESPQSAVQIQSCEERREKNRAGNVSGHSANYAPSLGQPGGEWSNVGHLRSPPWGRRGGCWCLHQVQSLAWELPGKSVKLAQMGQLAAAG